MVSACSVSINCQVNKRYDQSVWCQNMFGSCWKFLCNNSVLTKSANYKNKNNKHLCTKYKCIQIFQNLYIFGNRFWKKRWEKTVQSIIDGAKTEHYYSASVLFCIVYIYLHHTAWIWILLTKRQGAILQMFTGVYRDIKGVFLQYLQGKPAISAGISVQSVNITGFSLKILQKNPLITL